MNTDTPQYQAQMALQKTGIVGAHFPRFRVGKTLDANRTIITGFNDELTKFFEDYYVERAKITGNTSLSPLGQQEQLIPLERKYNTRFNGEICKRFIALTAEHLKKVDAAFELPPVVVDMDPVIRTMLAIEVRRYLLTLPQVERIKLVLNRQDPLTLFAVENSPACMEILPDGILERAQLARVTRLRAAELLPLQDERLALLHVRAILMNVTVAFSWLNCNPALPVLADSCLPAEEDIDPQIGADANQILGKDKLGNTIVPGIKTTEEVIQGMLEA